MATPVADLKENQRRRLEAQEDKSVRDDIRSNAEYLKRNKEQQNVQ